MQISFAPRMDAVIGQQIESIWKAYSLDELLESFLSCLLHVDHVREVQILLYNKRHDLIPVASALNVPKKDRTEPEVSVQTWLLDSSVVHSTRRVSLPKMHLSLCMPLLQGADPLGFLHIKFDRILTSIGNRLPLFFFLENQLSAKIKEIMLKDEVKAAKTELQQMLVNNREMFQQVTSLSKELYAITAISTKINQSMEFQKSLRKSIAKIREVFKASSIAFYMKEGASSRLRLFAMDVSGDDTFDTGLIKKILKRLEKSLVRDVVVLGKPLIKDLRTILQEKTSDKLASGGIKSLVAVPMYSRHNNIGAVLLLHTKPAGSFGQESLRLLSGMANIMGMAIENINLYTQTERKKKEAAFLVKSIEQFHKTLDLKSTLRSVAEEGAKLIGEGSTVYLFSKTRIPMIQVRCMASDNGATLKTTFFRHIQPPELSQIYNDMILRPKAVLLRDVNRGKRMETEIRGYLQNRGIHSLIGVPLTLKGETLGLLLLGKDRGNKPLEHNELSVAEALGSAAAVAIQNARAYTSSLEMSEFLEKKISEKISQIEAIQETQRVRVERRNDIIFRVNRNNRFVFVNKAMEDLTGYSREAFCRGDVLADEIVAEKDRAAVRSAFVKILKGELAIVKDLEYRQRAKGGEERIISLTIYPESDASHRIIGIEGVGKDVTQEKKLAEELTKTRELALLGEFSADIAHQIRNPLSNILMAKKRLENGLRLDAHSQGEKHQARQKLSDFQSAQEDLEEVFGDLSEGISNLNQIVTELLQYTKTLKLTRSYQRIDMILGEIPKMFEDVIRKNGIAVMTEFDPELPLLDVDALLMGQVFQNVIHNAIAAMPNGGRLLVRSGFCCEMPGYAFISICDSGVGIKPSEIENIFRPFYSTRPGGVGLGLSLAHRIVEAHNGIIRVCHNPCPKLDRKVAPENRTNPDQATKGTTMHILLPLDGASDRRVPGPIGGC